MASQENYRRLLTLQRPQIDAIVAALRAEAAKERAFAAKAKLVIGPAQAMLGGIPMFGALIGAASAGVEDAGADFETAAGTLIELWENANG